MPCLRPARRVPQPQPQAGRPEWNVHRRHPPFGAGAGLPGGPPARVVYVLHDAVYAATAALVPPHHGGQGAAAGESHMGWANGGGILGQCARAGCLLSLALEVLEAVKDNGSESGDGMVEDCSDSGTALGWYAVGGADFLLLQHHFTSWADAARTGAFQAPSLHDVPA